MVYLTGELIVDPYNKMVNIWLFSIFFFKFCMVTFSTKVKNVIILYVAYTITIFRGQLGAANCLHGGLHNDCNQ